MKHIKTIEMFNSNLGRIDSKNYINDTRYSKNIGWFKPANIKLLRSINDIQKEYSGEDIDAEYFEDSNLDAGSICQLLQTPDGAYSVGIYNSGGSGTSYYTIRGNKKLIEDKDFIFV